MIKKYRHSVINHGLAVRENANGSWRQVEFPTVEFNIISIFSVVVCQESCTEFGSRSLIKPSLHRTTASAQATNLHFSFIIWMGFFWKKRKKELKVWQLPPDHFPIFQHQVHPKAKASLLVLEPCASSSCDHISVLFLNLKQKKGRQVNF